MPEKDYLIVRNGESQSYSAEDFNHPDIQNWLGQNKDAQSYEVSAYNDQDETLDGDFFQIYNEKGEHENYSREDFEDPSIQAWVKQNPKARIARVRPVGPWGDDIRKQYSHQRAIDDLTGNRPEAGPTDEQRAQLDAKRQRIADLQSQLDNYNKKASEEMGAITTQQGRLMKQPEQEKKRSEIRKQLEEAERAYYTDPIVLGENERGAQAARTGNEELEKIYSGIKDQKEASGQQAQTFGGSSIAAGGAPAFYGEDEDQKMYNATKRLNDAAIRLREAPSKYEAVGGPGYNKSNNESGFNNFMKGAKDRVSEADFWTLGLTGIQDQLQLKEVFDKIRTELGGMNEITEKNIDETLSPMEKQLLAAFFRNADAQAARANDLSRGYQAGQSAADSLQFMAQFALSGAVTGAAAKALSKSSVSSMSEWIAKAIAKVGAGLGKQAFGRVVGDIAEGAAGALFQPGAYKSALEAMNQLDENGEIVNQNKAFWKGLADYGIEVFSERTGDYIPNVLGALTKTGKIANLTSKLANTELGKWGRAFYNSDALRMLKAGGWNGYFGEMSEEFIGAALRSATGLDPDAWKEQWDKDNLAVMALSFLPMSIFGGTVNTVKYGAARKNLAESQEDLLGRLQTLGFDEKQISHAMDITRLSSPEKIRETIKPIVDEMADRGATKQDRDALMDYAMAAATLNAYEGYESEKVQQQRNATRAELQGEYGDFWQGNEKSGRTVQRVSLPDGRTGFVLNTDETGLMSVRFDDGTYGYTDTAHGAQVEESSLDSYLDSVILTGEQAQDAARMQEEAAAARQQFNNNLAQNADVPMGTPERQEIGKLLTQQDPNTGAITPVRDANGNYIVATMNGQTPISENDLAAKWGIKLQPETREHLDADAVAEYEASKKRVYAYNTIPQGSTVEANLEGLEEPVPYQFTRAVYNDETGEVEIKVWDEENQREETLPESAFPDLQQAAAQYSAPQPAAQAPVAAEAPAVDNTPRDFRGNPLPMKDDGRVNQGELWEKDPEAWAAWNDQQRQDGGANTRAYVQAAASKVQGEITKAQKEYAKELDFDRREAIEQQIAEKTKRLNILNSILGGYKSREEAAENRIALDSITTDDGEIVAGRTFAEVKKYVQDSIKQLEGLKEKMSEASDEIDAKLLNLGELAGMMDTVEQMLPEITAPQAEEIDLEPRTPLELAAWLFANGKIKITHEAFAKELGLRGKGGKGMSREAKNFLAILRKDGMSIETAGERLEEAVRENQVAPLPDETNAGRDVIIELFSRVNSFGDIKKFIEREHRAQAEEDRKAQLRMYEDATMKGFGMDLQTYNENLDELRKNMLLEILGLPTEYINFESKETQENGSERSGETTVRESVQTDGPMAGSEGSEEESVDSGAGEEVRPGEVPGVREVPGESEGAGERGIRGNDTILPSSGEAGGGESSAAESSEVEDLPDGEAPAETPAAEDIFAEADEQEEERRRQQPLRDRIKEWEDRTGQEIEIIGSFDEIKEQSVRMQVYGDRSVKGWFNLLTNKVVVYLPNTTDVSDIDKTYLHEIISHKGLRELLGQDGFNVLMDHVYSDVMTDADRQRYAEYNRHLRTSGTMSEEQLRRADADEFVARLAEDMDANPSAWAKFVALFKEALMKLNLNIQITEQDLSALLHASLARYESMQHEAREQERSRMEAQQQRNEDAAAFVAGERTRAADTAKVEATPQAVIASTKEKYEDFGEKIGWAKKDLATRGFSRKKGEGDNRPSWRKKYEAVNVVEMSEGDKAMARRFGIPTDFQEAPVDITSKGPDFSKPFVGFYVKKSKAKYGRDTKRYITDESGKPIIFTSEEQFEAAIPVFEVKDQGFRISKQGEQFKIVRPASNNKLVEYDVFSTREEAAAFLASPESCSSLLNRKRENFELPALSELTRNNMPDYRMGRDITPDDFQRTFEFRGGEFGNWLNAEEQQQALNYAYDALMDLANVLGITPSALSLNGELSIAFGARGEGGAKAHYEPTKAVINLTKMKGAGSLAHEWAHALDNYFGLMDAKQTRNREEDVKENQMFLSEGSSWKKGAREEVRDAFRAVMKAIKEKRVTRKIAETGANERVERRRNLIEREKDSARKQLERGLTRYVYNRKTKQREEVKFTLTPEQLTEYDRLVDQLETDPTFKWEFTFGKNGWRASGEIADKIYELIKDVAPNRAGQYGPLHNLFYEIDKLRPELKRSAAAREGAEETVTVPTTLLEDSKWFDRGRASSYYAKDIELFARAFENYVSGEMQGQDQSSDYLTYEKGPLYKKIWGYNPYPEGEERSSVKMAFDHLFDTIQEKVDEQTGNTMLFRKNGFAAKEGNVYFRKGRSLVGMHNISESKLAKAMNTGGLANPSAAVVDIAKQSHEDYGEISLIMPSSLVDSETGRNIGTFLGDAWTPTYPGTQKIMGDEGWDTLVRDLRSLPDEIGHRVRLAYDNYLEDDRIGDALKWWFLQDTGRNPGVIMNESKLPEDVRAVFDGIESADALTEDREAFNRVAELFRQMGNSEEVKKAETRLEAREGAAEFVKRKIAARNAEIDKYGIAPNAVKIFFQQMKAQLRKDGTLNEYDTFSQAADSVEMGGLQEEFQEWLNGKDEKYGAETKLFAGWTRDGNKKWIANTVENASRLMNGEPQQNAYGNNGLSATRAGLVRKMRTLAEIRKHGDLLVSPEEYEKNYKEMEDRLAAAIEDLANRQKISDNEFSNFDYAESRLQEALPMRSPAAYLNAEYGYSIPVNGEYAESLKQLKKALREMPAKYFETKFGRPVMLDEFAAAVVPSDISDKTRKTLTDAGLPIFEYDPNESESRREATMKATKGDNILFRKAYHGSGASFDRFDHSHMGEGEGAQAHGWGTYVSFNEDTAKGYATRSGRSAGYGERMAIRESIRSLREQRDQLGERNKEAAERHMEWVRNHPEATAEDKAHHERIAEWLSTNQDPYYRGVDRAIHQRELLVNSMEYGVTYKHADIHTPLEEMEVIADAVWSLNRLSKPTRQAYLDYYRYDVGQMPEGSAMRRAYDFIASTSDEDWTSNRNLYTVEIPEDTGLNYMDEQADAKLTDVAEVWEALSQVAEDDVAVYLNLPAFHEFNHEHTGKSNEYLYRDLARILGSQKEASKLLERIGYAGIKYDGHIDGPCAVIFNDQAIQITDHIRFRRSNEEQRIFISNAEKAVSDLKMDKATPEQWKKTLEKNGGLKAAEDKWLGLSTWLDGLDRKTVTKQEVLDYIAENQIQMEEQRYAEEAEKDYSDAIASYQKEYAELVEKAKNNNEKAPYVHAYNEMADLYGERFFEAFEFDGETIAPTRVWAGDDSLSSDAMYFLDLRKENPTKGINPTRLGYTTEGLRNRQEIALTVPTIEPWNESDRIHFGDAGEGRAISWARFGDTWTSKARDEAEKKYREADKAFRDYRDGIIAKYTEQKPSDGEAEKAYADFMHRFSDGHAPTREEQAELRRLEAARNAALPDRSKIREKATPEENAKVKELQLEANRLYHEWQYGAHPREKVLVIDEIQSKRHQEAREQGGYKDDSALKRARARRDVAKEEYDKYHASLLEKYGNFNELHDNITPEENAESQRLYQALRDAANAAERNGFDPMEDEEYRRLREEQQAHENNPEFKRLMDEWKRTFKESTEGEGKEAAQGRLMEIDEQLKPLQERNRELINAMEARERVLVQEFNATHKSQIPAAPFEKNWHELTMKRMLRYAAENGYDTVAWTTGEQQAERYNLSRVVNRVNVNPFKDGSRDVTIHLASFDGEYKNMLVDENGIVTSGEYNGQKLSAIVGADLATKIMGAENREEFEGEDLKVGGEGMKGFYDDILPRFMNKYGKKWGVKVEDIFLPALGADTEAGAQKGLTMHSVPVTEEMKDSVMSGQIMFRRAMYEEEKNEVDNIDTGKLLTYHGTGADFERFDHTHMGEGEGSQVYGWGTYVTTNRDTGVEYAVNLAGNTRPLEEQLQEAEREMDTANEDDKWLYEERIKDIREKISAIEGKRHLYSVEIPEDNGENYIHWDEPLTRKQSKKIMDAVRKVADKDAWGDQFEYELQSALGPGTYGRYVEGGLDYFLGNEYNYATDENPGAERNAKLLNSVGIVGIQIPIDRNGGQRYEGSNYVIFNEDDLEIVDHTRFRITPEQDAEYMEAVNAGDMEKAQQMVNDAAALAMPNTKVVDKDGKPMAVYHGTPDMGFTVFAQPGEGFQGLIWMTDQKRYAEVYAEEYDGEGYPNEGAGVYSLFANIENPLDMGYIEDVVGSDSWNNLADKLGMTPEELFNRLKRIDSFTYEDAQKRMMYIYDYTRDAEFANLLKEKGFDGAFALEEGINKTPTYAAVDPSQVKSADPVTRDDQGNVIPLSERFNEGNDDIRFRVAPMDEAEAEEAAIRFRAVQDPLKIAELEAGEKIPGYRTVVLNPDGSMASPMAGELGVAKAKKSEDRRVKTSSFTENTWNEAEENPDLADENGKIKLIKTDNAKRGLVDVDEVDYNPYNHLRLSPVNLQFKDAWKRPDLIYIKSEVPKSEAVDLRGIKDPAEKDRLSPYHAEKAVLPVGIHDWSGGGELLLSRWDKPVGQVAWEEIADAWANDEKVKEGVQFDRVPPQILDMLVERGIEILPPSKGKDKNEAYKAWKAGDQEAYEAWRDTGKAPNKDKKGSAQKKKLTPAQKKALAFVTGEKTDEENIAEANTLQKQPVSEQVAEQVVDRMEPEIRFRLSNNNRATVESWLKKREDLTDEQRASVIDFIDDLDDAKLQLATARWFANKSIRIPEDMDKVKQAVSVAGKAKVDPLQYDNPMSLLEAHANFKPTAERINPDNVPTLHKAEEYPEGVVVYDVDEGEESRKNMRQIINTHFGEDASPWCLLQGDGKGNLTKDSKKYWNHYNAYPKQAAFKDGKLLAFSANDSGTKVWWDRQDTSHYGIPITKKIEGDEIGRSAVHVLQYDAVIRKDALERDLAHKYNCPPYRLRELANPEDIAKLDEVNREIAAQMQAGMLGFQKEGGAHPFKGNRQNGVYEEWSADGDTLIERTEYKDGKANGISEAWFPNGQQESRYEMKDDHYVGQVKVWFDNGQVRLIANFDEDSRKDGKNESWFKNGNKRYETEYKHGQLVGERREWDEDGTLANVYKYDDSGEMQVHEVYGPHGIERRYTYPNDHDCIEERFYRGGRLSSIERTTDGQLEGLQEYFYTDGKVQDRGNYHNGKRDGIYEKFHPNGQLWMSQEYKDGEKEGIREVYDKDGNLNSRGIFHNNELVEDTTPRSTMFRITPEQDKEYMDAVNAGDMEKAGKMVKDAFKAAFPNTKIVDENGDPIELYHGTKMPFWTFDGGKARGLFNDGLNFFALDRQFAEDWARRDDDKRRTPEVNQRLKEAREKRLAHGREIVEKIRQKYGEGVDYSETPEWQEYESTRKQWERENLDLDGMTLNEAEYELGKRVLSVYINSSNPYNPTEKYDSEGKRMLQELGELEQNPERMSEYYARGGAYLYYEKKNVVDELKKRGYDSIYLSENVWSDPSKNLRTLAVWDANRIKSADPVTYDDNGNVIPLSQRFNESNPDIRFRVAYHGSPNEFEEFDTSFVGDGQGHQSHGWGIYVSLEEGTARRYGYLGDRDKVVYQGQEPPTYYAKELVATMTMDMANRGTSFDEAKKSILDSLNHYEEKRKDAGNYWRNTSYKREIDFFENLTADDFKFNESHRNLYIVDIPDDTGENYIDEQKNLKKPMRVRIAEAIRALPADAWRISEDEAKLFHEYTAEKLADKVEKGPVNGERVYAELSRGLGSPRAASEFLSNAGFVGIKYIGGVDGPCAVIFDAKDVEIDDHARFRVARTADDLVKRVQDYGLRGILDEDAAKAFWADAYAVMPEDVRKEIVDNAFSADADKQDLNIRREVRKYIAALAKKGYAEDESGLLRHLADRLKEELGEDLDENTLRYLIWRSANRYNTKDMLALAEDISMRRRLGVGEFNGQQFPTETSEAMAEAEQEIDSAEQERDAARAVTRTQVRKTPYTALNSAMSAQRKYDQEVVNSLVKLAKSMIKNMEGLTKREVSLLLTDIRDANGKRPAKVKEAAQKLLDLMIDHTIAAEKKQLEEMVKVRTKKVREPGVDTIAKLDVKTQNIVNAFRDNYQLSEEEIDKAIEALEDRLDDKRLSETSLEDLRNKLEGLQLAKQYAAEIAAKEADIKAVREMMEYSKAEFDGLTTEEKRQLRTARNEEIAADYEVIRSKKIEQVEAYRRLRGDIAKAIAEGADRAQTFLERERERVEQIHHWANADMQGVETTVSKEEPKKSRWELIKNGFGVLALPLANTEQLLRMLGRKSVNGFGYLYNHFAIGIQKASDNMKRGVDEAYDRVNAKIKEIFDDNQIDTLHDLFIRVSKMPKAQYTFRDASGNVITRELPVGNLLYIYAVNKMADGRMKLRQMNISEEDVEAIKKAIDPKLIEFVDWVQEDLLERLRDKYNETHKRMFGTSMAAIENYFPIRIAGGDIHQEVDLGQMSKEDMASVLTGAIIKRTINTKMLDIENADFFAVLADHIDEMEEWSAYAEIRRDVNTLLSYDRFRNQVMNLKTIYGKGEELWKLVKRTMGVGVEMFRPQKPKADEFVLNAAKGVSAAKVNFRVYTALKQILSMPAFLADASPELIVKSIATAPASWKWAMENLPSFKKRWESGTMGNEKLEKSDSDLAFWDTKLGQFILKDGMLPNRFVDALTVSIGAKAMYDTKKRQYIREGFSEEKADEKAKIDAELLFNATQQSSEGLFLSAVQKDRSVLSNVISVFRNSSMGYQRQVHQAFRTIGRRRRKGYKEESIAFMTKQLMREGLTEEQAKKAAEKRYKRSGFQAAVRLATFGFTLEFFWNIASHLPYLLFGDDPDEKKTMLLEDLRRAYMGGLVEGLAGGQAISQVLYNIRVGASMYGQSYLELPLVADFRNILSELHTDKVRAANDLINLAVQIGLGSNPQTLSDAIMAIYDACNADEKMTKEVLICIMRIMQVPQSQIDQFMIDEIGMTAADAQKLSYEEIAKRYSEYKTRRNAGVASPLYSLSEGLRENREKASQKTFKKKFNERKKLKEEE